MVSDEVTCSFHSRFLRVSENYRLVEALNQVVCLRGGRDEISGLATYHFKIEGVHIFGLFLLKAFFVFIARFYCIVKCPISVEIAPADHIISTQNPAVDLYPAPCANIYLKIVRDDWNRVL